MEKDNNFIKNFSPHIFWDLKIDKLDIKDDKRLIIERVFNYGTQSDEKLLYTMYTYREIKNEVKKCDELFENALSYLSVIFNIKKESFKCYRKKPLHWKC